MYFRSAIVTGLALASLMSCSSTSTSTGKGNAAGTSAPAPNSTASSSNSAAPETSPGIGLAGAGMCARLVEAAAALQALAPKFSDPASLGPALATEVTLLTQLRQGAPAEVAPAIDDLIVLVKAAEKTFADPAHPDVAALESLAATMPADAAKIKAYVLTSCPGVVPSS